MAVCDYKQVEVRARLSGRAPGEGPGRVGCRHSRSVMTLATVGDRAQRGRVSAGGPCTAIPLEGAQQLRQRGRCALCVLPCAPAQPGGPGGCHQVGSPGAGSGSGWPWAGTTPPLTEPLTCQAGGPAPGPGCAVAPAARGHEESPGVAEPQPGHAAHPLLVLGHGRTYATGPRRGRGRGGGLLTVWASLADA